MQVAILKISPTIGYHGRDHSFSVSCFLNKFKKRGSLTTERHNQYVLRV